MDAVVSCTFGAEVCCKCVAVCCSVLQCVEGCGRVLQRVAASCERVVEISIGLGCCGFSHVWCACVLQQVCCSELQYVALQYVAVIYVDMYIYAHTYIYIHICMCIYIYICTTPSCVWHGSDTRNNSGGACMTHSYA